MGRSTSGRVAVFQRVLMRVAGDADDGEIDGLRARLGDGAQMPAQSILSRHRCFASV